MQQHNAKQNPLPSGMGSTKMPSCHSCHKTFADYKELAMHISSSRKGHRRGKRWAAKYVMMNGLSGKAKGKHDNHREPLTEAQKENRRNSKLELSGANKNELTVCPKCRKGTRLVLPSEFTNSPVAWRIKDKLAVLCSGCGGKGLF